MPSVPAAQPSVPKVGRWSALLFVALAITGAWLGAGELVRRVRASQLPPLPELESLPAPVRPQLMEADAAARARPTSAETVGALGMAYHSSLVDDRAMDAYRSAEMLDSVGWRWSYYRALMFESRGQTEPALELFSRVTERNPSWGLAWFRIGEGELKRRRFDAAEHAYERARTAPPARAVGGSGSSLDSARNTSRPPGPSSQTPPLSAYAIAGLARAAAEQGNTSRARELLDGLLREQPRFGPAVRLTQLLPGAEPVRAAPPPAYVPPADPLLDAVVRLSRHSDVLLKHAALAARAGDRPWQEFLTRRALQFNPRDPDVLLEMAAMLQAFGKPGEALEYLRQHEAVAPDDHHGLVEQGKCLSDLGRLAEAEQVLRRAVRVPDTAAEYNLGFALDRQGRWDEARLHYERALTLDSFHARALNNLAVGIARRGDLASALALHARAVASAPDDADARSNFATTLLQQGRTVEAIAMLEQAIVLAPHSADAHNNLGVALGQAGRLAEAVSHFREALRVSPAHADARRNLARMSAILPPR